MKKLTSQRARRLAQKYKPHFVAKLSKLHLKTPTNKTLKVA